MKKAPKPLYKAGDVVKRRKRLNWCICMYKMQIKPCKDCRGRFTIKSLRPDTDCQSGVLVRADQLPNGPSHQVDSYYFVKERK